MWDKPKVLGVCHAAPLGHNSSRYLFKPQSSSKAQPHGRSSGRHSLTCLHPFALLWLCRSALAFFFFFFWSVQLGGKDRLSFPSLSPGGGLGLAWAGAWGKGMLHLSFLDSLISISWVFVVLPFPELCRIFKENIVNIIGPVMNGCQIDNQNIRKHT